jgi:hypothetical protein
MWPWRWLMVSSPWGTGHDEKASLPYHQSYTGPHALVIVLQTSDYEWESDNSGNLSGALGGSRIIHFSHPFRIITTVDTNILHQI